MDEYLADYIDDWIEENSDEDEYIQDSWTGNGPQKML